MEKKSLTVQLSGELLEMVQNHAEYCRFSLEESLLELALYGYKWRWRARLSYPKLRSLVGKEFTEELYRQHDWMGYYPVVRGDELIAIFDREAKDPAAYQDCVVIDDKFMDAGLGGAENMARALNIAQAEVGPYPVPFKQRVLNWYDYDVEATAHYNASDDEEEWDVILFEDGSRVEWQRDRWVAVIQGNRK